MRKLTPKQRRALQYLERHSTSGPHPSSHMRDAWTPDPAAVLSRLEKRGLVESNGVVMPDGKVYAITEAGREALKR